MSKRILVVDDDTMFSDMLSEILTEEGFTTLVEHDGATGLARALAEHPDLLIMDFMMPHLSGLEALKQLRADAWGKGIPVFLLTNMAQADFGSDAVGPTECLLKTDWTLDALAKKVAETLK